MIRFLRRHLFHIVDPNPCPLVLALGLFLSTSGLAFYMHSVIGGGYLFLSGLCISLLALGS